MCEVRDVKAVFGFMRLKGIGVSRTNKELLAFSRRLDINIGLEEYLYSSLKNEQQEEYALLCDKEVNHRYSQDVRFSMVIEGTYPQSLRGLLKMSTPPVLSMLGNPELLGNRKIGFSGSRKVSDTGLAITRDCAFQLSTIPGVSIVSGYAQGVDREAHYTALASGGSTIIVLPNGMSEFYVRKDLGDVWDWKRVLVISEYLPEDKWSVARAMNRNRTIIGISDAMLVAEAGSTGGSLDAGKRTLSDGKPLFVPCYASYPESASGNDQLLRQGAIPILRNRQTKRANVDKMIGMLAV